VNKALLKQNWKKVVAEILLDRTLLQKGELQNLEEIPSLFCEKK
jgi:hypothetical protein